MERKKKIISHRAQGDLMYGIKVLITLAAISSAWLLACTGTKAAEFQGRVTHVTDGDTFNLLSKGKTLKIRICGIDAPEEGQTGYTAASEALRQMIYNKEVRCVQVGGGTPCDGRSKPTNRDRLVAQCFLVKNDIAVEMVRQGLACAWPKYSATQYLLPGACQRN